MDTLRSRLPSAEYDEVWGEEEEEALLASFPEDDVYRVYVLTKTYGSTTNYLSMWRKICRLRGCFPEQIIGAKHYLEYGEQVEVERGVWKPDPNWTKNFCKVLEVLVISSPCGDNMGLLGLFIRYTVACYIDRRMVPVHNSETGHKFFDVLGESIRLEKGTKPLKEIGRGVREGWTNRGLRLPWDARVLEQIELLAAEEAAELTRHPAARDQGQDEVQIYQVLTRDLELLLRAIKRVQDLGFLDGFTMADRQSVISYARGVGDAPNNMKELGELRVQLVLDDMRIRAKRAREAPDDDNDEDDPFADAPDPFSILDGQQAMVLGAGRLGSARPATPLRSHPPSPVQNNDDEGFQLMELDNMGEGDEGQGHSPEPAQELRGCLKPAEERGNTWKGKGKGEGELEKMVFVAGTGEAEFRRSRAWLVDSQSRHIATSSNQYPKDVSSVGLAETLSENDANMGGKTMMPPEGEEPSWY